MSSRRRDRKEERRELAKQWAREAEQSLEPAEVFTLLSDIPPNSDTVSLNRVSSKPQRSNLPAQIADNVRKIIKEGHEVVGVHSKIIKACIPEWFDFLAQIRHRYQTPYFVAEHFDRFLRSPDFGAGHYYEVPDSDQLEEFQQFCKENDIIPVVIHSPDTDPKIITRLRTRRGLYLHGKNRDQEKKRRRKLLKPIAQHMAGLGFGEPEIAENLCLSRGGVWHLLRGNDVRSAGNG